MKRKRSVLTHCDFDLCSLLWERIEKLRSPNLETEDPFSLSFLVVGRGVLPYITLPNDFTVHRCKWSNRKGGD